MKWSLLQKQILNGTSKSHFINNYIRLSTQPTKRQKLMSALKSLNLLYKLHTFNLNIQINQNKWMQKDKLQTQ